MLGITPSEFGKNPYMWIGVVEDRSDPQQRGRLRVRIFGRHTQDTNLIPTDNLPWAIPIQSINSAAIGGVGNSPTGIMEGSMVIGFFLDGNDMQMPCVLGTVGPIEGVTSANSNSGNGTVNADGVQDSNMNLPGNVKFSNDEPKWLSIAKGEIGVKEFAGSLSNPRIMEYHKAAGLSATDDVPWCSSFITWCLKQAGQSTQGGGASSGSWATAACMEKIDTPIRGCIAIFARPPVNMTAGHAGFVDSVQGGNFMLVHGNTSNSVARSAKSMANCTGLYWPRGFPKEPYSVQSS